MVVALAVVVAVIVGTVAALGAFSRAPRTGGTPAQVIVTGFTFTPDYTGTASGYLVNVTCASGCPFVVAGGASFPVNLTLTNSAMFFDHYIDGISVSSPFSVVSVSPPLPFTLPPGGSQRFTVTVQAPVVTGFSSVSYSIVGSVVTN